MGYEFDNYITSQRGFNYAEHKQMVCAIKCDNVLAVTSKSEFDGPIQREDMNQNNITLSFDDKEIRLNNCIIKIPELQTKEIIKHLPFCGSVNDTVVTKIVFEVIPESSQIIFNAE